MTLTAERIYDVQVCMAVMRSMWDEISEDGVSEYIPDVINEFWVAILADGVLVGMYRIHRVMLVCYQIHAFMVDRSHKSSGECILRWCMDNIDDMEKLIAEIPDLYPNVYNFTKNQGFKDEGVNRLSFSKNGKIHDMYRLGMTRQEIEQWLQQ